MFRGVKVYKDERRNVGREFISFHCNMSERCFEVKSVVLCTQWVEVSWFEHSVILQWTGGKSRLRWKWTSACRNELLTLRKYKIWAGGRCHMWSQQTSECRSAHSVFFLTNVNEMVGGVITLKNVRLCKYWERENFCWRPTIKPYKCH